GIEGSWAAGRPHGSAENSKGAGFPAPFGCNLSRCLHAVHRVDVAELPLLRLLRGRFLVTHYRQRRGQLVAFRVDQLDAHDAGLYLWPFADGVGLDDIIDVEVDLDRALAGRQRGRCRAGLLLVAHGEVALRARPLGTVRPVDDAVG